MVSTRRGGQTGDAGGRGVGGEGGRGRRGRGNDPNATPPDEAARKAEADRRAIAERYEEALATHAKSRNIQLPTFR